MTPLHKLLADVDRCFIMLDLETASLKPKAAITSIGAIAFCYDAENNILVKLDTYYVSIAQLAYATPEMVQLFDVDLATIEWRTNNLPPESGKQLMPKDAAVDFKWWVNTFYGNNGNPFFVMKPSKFDGPIMDNFTGALLDSSVIDRHKILDLETICWAYGYNIKSLYDELAAPASAHHALHDCEYQLAVLLLLLEKAANDVKLVFATEEPEAAATPPVRLVPRTLPMPVHKGDGDND